MTNPDAGSPTAIPSRILEMCSDKLPERAIGSRTPMGTTKHVL